jgi:hypothetical protein
MSVRRLRGSHRSTPGTGARPRAMTTMQPAPSVRHGRLTAVPTHPGVRTATRGRMRIAATIAIAQRATRLTGPHT